MENGAAYSITFDAQTARYVRVNVAATNSTYCAASELEIYNDDGTIREIIPLEGAPKIVTKRIVQDMDAAYYPT